MSANNIVRIKEYKESPRFRVSDQCVECEPHEKYFGAAETLEEAIEIANKYQQEEIVEYGISINLIKKI